MKSPFQFGSTVSNSAFTNRKQESDLLYNNLTNNINTIIISPRRWGKSSLVEHITNKLKKKNKDIVVIQLDLFSIQSEESFLTEFARLCIKGISNKWEEWSKMIKETFRQLIPRLVINTEAGDFALEFDPKQLINHKQEILHLPEFLARKKKRNVIICIDEFQNIRNYPHGEGLEKSLRAIWQRHKNVTYCLYGSKRHMMAEIFNESSNPFYRFGDIMMLSKIEEQDWINFIKESFQNTGKFIDTKQATRIAQIMDCHPWYVQQLAHYSWIKTKRKVSDEIIDSSLRDIMDSQLPFFQIIIDKLSNTQVNLLKAILSEETQFTSTGVMRNYGLGTPNNVRKNLKTLKEQDIIDLHQGKYIFLDPVFKRWMEKTFLTINN